MPVFPSEEWMKDFCQRLEAKPGTAALAEDLAGVYRFVVEPAGPLHDRQTYDVEVSSDPGDGRAVELVAAEGVRPRLTMSADYNRWRQLIRGELDVALALLLRRVRVSGDLAALMGKSSAAQPLLEALREVDSEWMEER